MSLAEPPDDWLPRLPMEYRKREVRLSTLGEARKLAAPAFVKPPNDKSFAARVYRGDEMLAKRLAAFFVQGDKVYAAHRVRDPKTPEGFRSREDRSLVVAHRAFVGNAVCDVQDGRKERPRPPDPHHAALLGPSPTRLAV